jgi:hypothetical protein
MGIGFAVLYSLLLRAGYTLRQWTTNEGMGNFARSPHRGSRLGLTFVRPLPVLELTGPRLPKKHRCSSSSGGAKLPRTC